MSFKVMADNSESISSSQDGAMYNVFAGNQDFIIGDIGNEMTVSTNTASRVATVGTGECVIGGRHVSAVGTNTITLPASSRGYLVLRYDLSSSTIASLQTATTLEADNLNDGGTTRDLLLGTYVTTSSGVSQFIDGRVIKTAIFDSTEVAQIYSGTTTPSDTLGKNGDLYIQYGNSN